MSERDYIIKRKKTRKAMPKGRMQGTEERRGEKD